MLGWLIGLGGLVSASFGSGPGWACEPVTEVGATEQVAWVSRQMTMASNESWLQVVRLGDLRGLVTKANRDSATVLRGLGLLGRTQKLRAPYKVTVFDVQSSMLCRPMDGEPGTMVAGLPICDDREQRAAPGTKGASYTGCGYVTDLSSGVRGPEVLRVRWGDAVREGFCMLPWERLLREG